MRRNTPNKEKLRSIIKIISYGALILLIIYMLVKGLITNSAPSLFSIIGTFISLAMICWDIFDKYLWVHFFPEKLPGKWKTPVLYGRWEGELKRSGKKHDFVLEIQQTFTEIMCNTYTNHSSSSSIMAEIICTNGNYELLFYWDGETKSNIQPGLQPSPRFYGFTTLMYCPINRTLEGKYFTDRAPTQTKGDITLKYQGAKISGCFKIE